MNLSRFNWKIILALVVLICPLAVYAQDYRVAPISREFQEYLAARQTGTLVAKTADGHGLGYIPPSVDLARISERLQRASYLHSAAPVLLPATYDLRTLGRVTTVKNQGIYGTCWAHGALASLESYFLTAETWDFSENNMANLAGFDWGFDDGGNSIMATAYLTRYSGPVLESDDPYPNPGGSSSNLPVMKHVQWVRFINSTNITDMKEALTNYGVVNIAFRWDSTYYSAANYSFYDNNSWSTPNHAVAIVGWDDSFSSNNFNFAPPANGAYIVKNSWDTSWGSNGYFYMSYYDGGLKSSQLAYMFSGESTSQYDTVYQYDRLGYVTDLMYGHAEGVAVVFTAASNGALQAVSTYALGLYDYELEIYTGVSGDTPTNGVLAHSQTGTFPFVGYCTIALSSSVNLTQGESFSVVLRLNNAAPNVAIESLVAGYSSGTVVSSNSYDLDLEDPSLGWQRITDFNICIKAFASSVPSCGLLQFNSAAYSVNEGATNVTLTVTRQCGSLSNATVQYATRDGTAVASRDYVATAGTLSWSDGDATARTIVVPIVTDTTYEPNGTFAIDLSNATGASLGADATTQVQISAPPTNLAASSTFSDKVRLTWSTVVSATGYEIYRHTANNSTGLSVYASTTDTAYDDTATAASTIYFYWVKTVFGTNRSDFSAAASGYRALAAPAGLTVSAGLYTDKIRATWDAVAGASSYKVWRSASSTPTTAALLAEIADPAYNDTSASPGLNYYYWISSKKWQPAGILTSAFSSAASGWRRGKAATDNGRGDYDGDNRFDPAVYHRATGTWLIMLSASGYHLATYYLGGTGFVPVPGDYDGDGLTDVAVYHEDSGLWTALLSSGGNAPVSAVLGGSGYRAQPRDFDGDGKTDLAVYQLSTGTWKVLLSRSRYLRVDMSRWLGGAGYTAVSADYDGDGYVDPAVYQIVATQGANALWQVKFTSAGYNTLNWVSWASGLADEFAAPADYDGDGKADAALYDPALSTWNAWPSSLPFVLTLGGVGCVPVPGDYDADGKADPAVYQESTGEWVALISGNGYAPVSAILGGPGYEAARPTW